MAVAHDKTTLSSAFTSSASTTSHVPVGTPRGVTVEIGQVGGTEDQITSVTYGGVTMTRLRKQDTLTDATEKGSTYLYFLGSGIPTGTQNVVVTPTGARVKIAAITTVTADSDTSVPVHEGGAANATANPSLSISPTAAGLILYVITTGLDAPVTTVQSGTTHFAGSDRGSQSVMWAGKPVSAAGATTVGYTAAASDFAHLAASVEEGAPPSPTSVGRSFTTSYEIRQSVTRRFALPYNLLGGFNLRTYDWAANTGPDDVTAYPVTTGSVLLDGPGDFDSGSGTPENPWIYDGHILRDDPAQNAIGTAVSNRASRNATLIVAASNVIIRNVDAPLFLINRPSSSPLYNDIRIERCKFGIWDYTQDTAPTVDKFTGGPIANTAFRQFWWDTDARIGYYHEPGGSGWLWAAEFWGSLAATAPANPVVNQTWVEVDPVSTSETAYEVVGQGYHRWNGTSWDVITADVCPNVVGPNNGQNESAFNWRQVTNIVVEHCDIQGWEDGAFASHVSTLPKGTDYTMRYSWIHDYNTVRARYQPHGDMVQFTGHDQIKFQRCFLDNPGSRWGGTGRYSATALFKSDQETIDDVLIAECRIGSGQNTIQPRKSPSRPPPSNFRVRNCLFDDGTHNVISADTVAGEPIKWTENQDFSGNSIPVTSARVSTLEGPGFTDDGDPSGEGTLDDISSISRRFTFPYSVNGVALAPAVDFQRVGRGARRGGVGVRHRQPFAKAQAGQSLGRVGRSFNLAYQTAGRIGRSFALGYQVTTPQGPAFYVDSVNGDDTRSVTQAQNTATPWRTVAKAIQSATSNSLVYLRNGTYAHSSIISAATRTDYTTILPYPGENPVINDLVLGRAVTSSDDGTARCTFVRFQNLKFSGALALSFGCRDIKVIGCNWEQVPLTSLLIKNGVQRVTIDDNVFTKRDRVVDQFGIFAGSTATSTPVTDLVIRRNNVGVRTAGLNLRNVRNCVVEDNDIQGMKLDHGATTLAAEVNATQTTIEVVDPLPFPDKMASGQWFKIQVESEIMDVTSTNNGSTTWTVVRGAKNSSGATTTAAEHPSGSAINRHNPTHTGAISIVIGGFNNLQIRRNKMHDCESYGILCKAPPMSDLIFENNLIYNVLGTFVAATIYNVDGVVCVNNTIEGSLLFEPLSGASATDVVAFNNIVSSKFGPQSGATPAFTYRGHNTATQHLGTLGTNDITDAPIFAGENDFRLSPFDTSAKEQGVAEAGGVTAPTDDVKRNVRTGVMDRGCYDKAALEA